MNKCKPKSCLTTYFSNNLAPLVIQRGVAELGQIHIIVSYFRQWLSYIILYAINGSGLFKIFDKIIFILH